MKSQTFLAQCVATSIAHPSAPILHMFVQVGEHFAREATHGVISLKCLKFVNFNRALKNQ
jgi:hypothetical protein